MLRTLLRRFLFALAMLSFMTAAVALLQDAAGRTASGPWGWTSFGALWSKISPIEMAQLQRSLAPEVWDGIVGWLMLQPASAVLGCAGLFLLALRPMRERRRGLTFR